MKAGISIIYELLYHSLSRLKIKILFLGVCKLLLKIPSPFHDQYFLEFESLLFDSDWIHLNDDFLLTLSKILTF